MYKYKTFETSKIYTNFPSLPEKKVYTASYTNKMFQYKIQTEGVRTWYDYRVPSLKIRLRQTYRQASFIWLLRY